VPAVVLEICAPDSTLPCGAVTVTEPALPLAPASAAAGDRACRICRRPGEAKDAGSP